MARLDDEEKEKMRVRERVGAGQIIYLRMLGGVGEKEGVGNKIVISFF